MTLHEIRSGAKAALRESERSAMLDTLLYFCLTGLLSLVLSLLFYAVDEAFAGTGGGLAAVRARSAYSMASTTLYVLSFAVSIASIFVSFGYEYVMLLRVRRQTIGKREFWLGFRMAGGVICLTLLTWIFVSLWSCLFVIPGIVAVYRYRLAPFVMMDNPGMPASLALRESSRLSRGHKGKLFALDVSFWYYYIPLGVATLLSNIDNIALMAELYEIPDFPTFTYEQTLTIYAVGILLSGVIYCWKRPHVTTAFAVAYDDLKQQDAQRVIDEFPPV